MVDRSGAMACPIDGTPLVMSERQSIEIDYCPQCRGVWLDRGELDKIIERSEAASAPAPRTSAPPPPQPEYRERGYDDRHYGGKPYKKNYKKSFLSELFD